VLLRPYLDELGKFEGQFNKIDAISVNIEAHVMNLYSKLNDKANKDRLGNIERELGHI